MIRVENITWRAGTFELRNVSFAVSEGKYAVLMGKTGCGKTSLLELICGLRLPLSGRIWLSQNEVTNTASGQRGIGYVPQDGALFPAMTVRDQLGFALRLQNRKKQEIAERVEELALALNIQRLLNRRPDGLSGGERQRVALGRALSARPRVLLFDEPLSALDAETHEDLTNLLLQIQRKTSVTVLHVTHQDEEAESLADVLFRFENGRIVELPRPSNSTLNWLVHA